MQPHGFDPRDGVPLFPVQHAGAIAAGDEQAVQDRQEENPLQGKFETPAGQQSLDDLRDLQLVPQPPEDQRRTDAAVGGWRARRRDGGRRAPSRLRRTSLPTARGRRVARFAATGRVGPRWRRRVVGCGLFPSDSRRFADRRAARIVFGGRTWRPPCGVSHCHHDNIRITREIVNSLQSLLWHHANSPDAVLRPSNNDLRPKNSACCRRRVWSMPRIRALLIAVRKTYRDR